MKKGLTRQYVRPALLAVSAVLLITCHPRQAHRAIRSEPAVQATVVTIQTTLQPQNKTFTHSLVIGSDRARSGDEVDRWRLFELKTSRVTFVDDIEKTTRIESLPSLVAQMKAGASQPLPPGVPRVEVTRGSAHRVIQGVQADQILMRAGTYVREVWVARHPAIPSQLFSMMLASAPAAAPLAGMTKAADEALLAVEGFPLADHSEIAYDDKKMVVDTSVVKIEQKSVPQSWLNVPSKYRDVTPKPAPPQATPPKKR